MEDEFLSSGSRELIQKFQTNQARLIKELAVEPLPRHKDRIIYLSWGDFPLTLNNPRFGVNETNLSHRPRGGWHVILAKALREHRSHILDWILWREAFLSLLLPHIRQIPETADLGLFAGLQYGEYSKSHYESLMKLWKQVSPPQHYQHYIYDAPFGFPLFNQVVNGQFLHRAILWLNTLRPFKSQIPLSTQAYTATLERWMLETHIPLTIPEHQILTAISQLTEPLHQSRLADQLSMSNANLSQHLTTLAQRHALRLNYFINLPLIGLTPYELLIQTPNQKTRNQVIEIFSRIPYTWFINPIQDTKLHCRIFIPTKHTSQFLNWLPEFTKDHNLLPIKPLRTAAIIQAWNFSIYLPNQGWYQDLTFQYFQMKAIYQGEYDEMLPPISTSEMSYELLDNSKEYPIELRPEDFTYFLRAADIHQITDRITAQASKELDQAGISDTAHMIYRRRIKQLEKMNVSHVKGMFPLHLGLDSVIQIYIYESKLVTEQIQKSLSVFPNLNGLNFDNGYGMIFLYVPNNCAVEVLSEIRKMLAIHGINSVIESKPSWQSITGFESPVKLRNYDTKRKEWKWDQSILS